LFLEEIPVKRQKNKMISRSNFSIERRGYFYPGSGGLLRIEDIFRQK
jgi:hypothetical protein